MASIDVAEGLSRAILEASAQATQAADRATDALNTSVESAVHAMKAAAAAAAASEARLARWTIVQAFSTVVLAGFTIAQVFIAACKPQ